MFSSVFIEFRLTCWYCLSSFRRNRKLALKSNFKVSTLHVLLFTSLIQFFSLFGEFLFCSTNTRFFVVFLKWPSRPSFRLLGDFIFRFGKSPNVPAGSCVQKLHDPIVERCSCVFSPCFKMLLSRCQRSWLNGALIEPSLTLHASTAPRFVNIFFCCTCSCVHAANKGIPLFILLISFCDGLLICSLLNFTELLGECRASNSALQADYQKLRAELDEQVSLRAQQENEHACLLKKVEVSRTCFAGKLPP